MKKEESNLFPVQVHIKVLVMIKNQFMEIFQQLSTEASSSNKDSEKAMILSPIDQFSALASEAQDSND